MQLPLLSLPPWLESIGVCGVQQNLVGVLFVKEPNVPLLVVWAK